MERDRRFMSMAVETTKQGIEKGQTPFGAVIVDKEGNVVANSHNTVWLTTDITAHAEITAIREACKSMGTIDLSGCTIYTTTEPCPMCFSAIHWAKIEKIVYGATIEDAAAAGFHELHIHNDTMKTIGKSEVKIGEKVMQKECTELFKLWGDREDKRAY